MLESAFAALQSLADPSLLLMLVIGVAAGLVMGLIPGLGGTGAVAATSGSSRRSFRPQRLRMD